MTTFRNNTFSLPTRHIFASNLFFKDWHFCLYYDRTVSRQEAKWERRGGRDHESQGSNLGHFDAWSGPFVSLFNAQGTL